MSFETQSAPPVNAANPVCFCCGDLNSPDYGSVFLQPEGTGATSYWFDRGRKSHAATYLPHHNPPPVGADIVLHRRTFRVAGLTDRAAAEQLAEAEAAIAPLVPRRQREFA